MNFTEKIIYYSDFLINVQRWFCLTSILLSCILKTRIMISLNQITPLENVRKIITRARVYMSFNKMLKVVELWKKEIFA